jgi:hypothetical protein
VFRGVTGLPDGVNWLVLMTVGRGVSFFSAAGRLDCTTGSGAAGVGGFGWLTTVGNGGGEDAADWGGGVTMTGSSPGTGVIADLDGSSEAGFSAGWVLTLSAGLLAGLSTGFGSLLATGAGWGLVGTVAGTLAGGGVSLCVTGPLAKAGGFAGVFGCGCPGG